MAIKLKKFKNRFKINGLYTAIRFSWDDSFEFGGESHDFWEIVFILSGKVEVTEDEKIYTLEKGNMILHAPMEFHRIKSKSDSPRGLILSFEHDGELPDQLKNGVFTLDDIRSDEYTALFDRAYHFVRDRADGAFAGQEIAALLSSFLIGLATVEANKPLDTSPKAILYQKIISSMVAGVTQNLTLEDFSRQNSVSISYIKQLFRQYAGISPKAYYTGLRTRHATELLKAGHSVAEISDMMSFSSPNYFSLFYKKNTGMLPSEIKRKQMVSEFN